MAQVTITIDTKKYEAEEGVNLLVALRQLGLTVPSLCYHPDFDPEENCRLCLVSVNGKVTTSCNQKVKKDMIVETKTPELLKLRKTNAELLLANFQGSSKDLQSSRLGKIADECGCTLPITYKPRKIDRKSLVFGNIFSNNLNKCIDCRNCVKACQSQGICAIGVENYGYKETIAKKHDKFCVYCGQCLAHCPSGAITTNPKEQQEIEQLLTKKMNKPIMVAQIAPAVRAAIGEPFGLPHGTIATEQLTEALKKIGFDYVFDTSVAADLTTVEEAKELVHRIQNKGTLPLFTSCCPGWVRYLGVYYPELLPHLTTVHSPQIMMGGILKWHWAKKIRKNPQDIYVVSIMPCLAKKWEAQRPDYFIDGVRRVDAVLTTVEIADLLKKNNIDIAKLKGVPMDDPLGNPTGAGVIFGASGGVMVSALRTGYYLLTGKNPEILTFEKIIQLEGYKTMEVKAPGLTLRVAAVDGLGNVEKLIQHKNEFDYVEIMSCRGGCIGGGGQPVPVSDDIRKKRAQSLFSIDEDSPVRFAHESKAVQALYKEFLTSEEEIRRICHYHNK